MTWRFKSRFKRRWPSPPINNWLPETAWRLLPGSAAAIFVGGLWQLGALLPLEQLGYVSLFRLRGERAWAEPIVLITIDDESLRRLGRYPWPRRYYTQLLQTLSATDQQPSAIAFDLILSEPSPDDAQLAQAIEEQGRVALGQAPDFQGLPLLPVPMLRSAAIDTGSLLNHRDSDGMIRSAQLQTPGGSTLGLVAVRTHALSQSAAPLPDLEQPLWVNWPGPVQRLPHYSFVDVLERRVPAAAWHHKIVLVGITAIGFDTLLTPFNASTPGTGVYYHAAVIDNLLKRNSLQVWERSALPWLLLGLTPALGWLLSGQRTGRQVLLGLGGCVLWGLGGWGLLYANQWLPMALPIGLGLTTTLAVVLCERLRMNHFLQQEVQHLWQAYPPLALPGAAALPSIATLPIGPSSVAGKQQQPRSASLQTAQQLADLAAQLGRAQATQAAIARSLSVGILAAEWKGPIWFCNPPAAQWLGVSLGQSLQSQLVPAWLSLDEWQADLYVLQQGVEVPAREVYRGDRWFQVKLEPLDATSETLNPLLKLNRDSTDDVASNTVENAVEKFNENGGMSNSGSFLLLLEDITSRKQIETNLTRQVQELEWISKLKDDFLSTVSHELRAPLTNMRLAIQLLKSAQTESKRDHYLSILATECRREGDLINDLLDLQRLENSAQQLQLRPIDLTLWLPPLVQTFQTRAASRQQHLQFQLDQAPLLVVSEQSSLERILTELLNNACKYTPPSGKILLTAAVTQPSAQAEPSSPHMTIIVQNSGITIAPQELPRIFDKFYRVPKGDPWQQGGTGLGLALVQRLVEQIQGKIEVTSSADRTQFILHLPAQSLVR